MALCLGAIARQYATPLLPMKRFNLLCLWIFANIFVLFKRRWLPLLISIVSAFLVVIMFKWGLVCANIQTHLHIQNVCKEYASGQSVGNLCPALCQHGSVSDLACHNFYTGKEAVFSGIWDNTSIVFKSPRKSTVKVIKPEDWLKESQDNYNSPNEEEFTRMIKLNIKQKFNMSINDIDAQKLSYYQYKVSAYQRVTEMANVWALLQDNEYLALTLYEKYDVFPRLVGSCGTMFAVQQLNSISGFWHLITLYDSKQEWRNRIKIAVKILEFLNILQNGPADPLHICDMKMNHFGLTEDLQKVKYLDLDSVHPRSVVNLITGDGSPCTMHSDCDFLDCRSFCNLVTSKCQFGVVNSNMQIVCEKIFLGWVLPGRVVVPGLLLGPHTPHDLVELLESCANPAREDGTPRAATSTDTQIRLHDFLTHLIAS